MAKIHPTAIISLKAELADDVEIGAYSYIGEHVKIGKGTIIHPQAQILEHCEIGEYNEISSSAIIGGAPQDHSYKNEPTKVIIGNHNQFREFVTVNRGTLKQEGKTVIGDHNMFMAYSHVAHDNTIGNHCVFTNMTQLAGHVTIGDRVVTSACVLVHQFVTIGELCFIAPLSVANSDCLPGCIYFGHPAEARVLNLVGLQRGGIAGDELKNLKTAFKKITRSEMSITEAIKEIENESWANTGIVKKFIDAARKKTEGKRGRSGAQT